MARSFSKKNKFNGKLIFKSKSSRRPKKWIPSFEKEYEMTAFTAPAFPLKLLRPLKFDVSYDNNLYIVENELFNIFSFDPSLEKAKADIEQQIYCLWEDFVLFDIHSLAPSGVQFRSLLQSYLGEKNEIQMP